MEKWTLFPECRTYEVSTDGKIRNAVTKHVLTGTIDRKGYVRYDLSCHGKRIVRSGHRIVALTYLQNTNKLPQVNHKNGIKTDNRIENLEWCTGKDNVIHTFKVLGRIPHNIRRVQCVETGKIYTSCTEAAGGNQRASGLISRCCSGKRKTAHGLHWKYLN